MVILTAVVLHEIVCCLSDDDVLTTGCGHFVSKTGQVGSALNFNLLKEDRKGGFELPDEVLASATTLERNYEAISINPGR